MRYEDASHTGAFQGSQPIANDDLDSLPAGSKTPATGNLITGEGTQTGSAGADMVAGAHVAAIAGKGGEDTSFSGGKLSVAGEFGRLSVDAEGNYVYQADKGVENVRDRFTYTLADNNGATDTASLIVEIGKTPVVIKANAQQIVPGPDGVVTLPPGVELSDIRVVGRNLVIDMPDGTQLIIVDGAIFVPQLQLGGVEVPSTNLAALLIGQEPQPAAGENTQSSGGNFASPVPPLDPGVPLGDLIPPTEYVYQPPEPQEVFPDVNDEQPSIVIQPDGQPASVNAVDSVDEDGLPTRNGGEPEGSDEGADGNPSNNSDTDETTAGTIIIDSPDGVDSVTINGVLVTGVVGQVIPGDFGTLTITGFNGDNILYSYTLTDNTSGDNTHDDFSVVLTDEDGDTATATLTIDIIDDVPTARNDTDATVNGVATGNVMTDAAPGDVGDSDTNAADTVGADNASLTAVSGFGGSSDSTFEGGFLNVNGQFGTLAIDAQGNYTYTVNPNAGGGGVDVFTYTLTDGDGDTTTATLTITNPDLHPVLPDPDAVLLDDDALAGGNPGGTGDDPDSQGLPGQLNGSGGDGALTYNFTGVDTVPAGFTVNPVNATTVQILQGATVVLTVTLNQATGAFNVVQNNPIDHAALLDENNVSFSIGVEVEDVDGDVEPASITINVDDDTPLANNDTDTVSAGTAVGNVITGVGTTEGAANADSPGADGFGAITQLDGFNGSTDNNPAGGFSVNGEFGTLQMDASGNYTYTRTDGLGGGESEVFTYTYVDGDGDPVSATLTIDIPDLTPVLPDPDAVLLDDDALAGGNPGGTGDDPDSQGLPGQLNGSGGDGALTYNFTGVDTVPAGFTVNPVNATTVQILQGATVVLTVTLNQATGAFNVVQNNPIDHAALLDENNVSFSIGVEVEDVDGDVEPASITINVDDDTPLANNDTDTVSAGTAVGNVITGVGTTEGAGNADSPGADGFGAITQLDGFNGSTDNNPAGGFSVNGEFGTLQMDASGNYTYTRTDGLGGGESEVFTYTYVDGDGDPVSATLTINIPNAAPVLPDPALVRLDDDALAGGNPGGTGDDPDSAGLPGQLNGSGGDGALTYNFTGVVTLPPALGFTYNQVDADTAQILQGATVVLTIELNQATGAFNVIQNNPIDHPVVSATEDNLVFQVGVEVEDADGDVEPATITINVDDDTPTATIVTTAENVILDESAGNQADSDDVTGPLAVFNGVTNKGDDPDVAGSVIQFAANAGAIVASTGSSYGADGAGTTVFSLNVSSAGVDSGLNTTDGHNILLYLENGIVVGRVSGGADDGNAAFAIAIDSSGHISMVEYLSIQHPDATDPDDSVSITDGAILAVVTVTDGDGDTATQSVGIGDQIQFQDSGPIMTSASDINIQNSGDVAHTGAFAFNLGADGANTSNDVITNVTGSATVGGVAVQNWTLTPGTEDATTATYSFSFDYPIGGGNTAHETGTLVFDKVAGTYTIDLANPIQGVITILQTAEGTLFQGYEFGTSTLDGSQPEVSVTQIQDLAGTANDIYVQFTSVAEPSSGTGDNALELSDWVPGADNPDPIASGGDTSWSAGQLFNQTDSWVSTSNSANGVAGDTIQGGEVLDFTLVQGANPTGTLAQPGTFAQASAMFLKFDGIGTGEDMIVVLKLYDPNTNTYTTRAIMVENSDIQKGPGTGPGQYSGITLDNNDGLVIIESNDYNLPGENWVIVGAQIAGSDEGITGTAIDLNSAIGAAGDSITGGAFDTDPLGFQSDTNDGPFKISSIGFLTTSTTPQNAQLDFNVTVTDGDGDSITQAISATVTAAADSTTPISLDPSVTTIQSGLPPSPESSSLLATDSHDHQLQKTAANSNTLTLAAAVAAAGVVETQAAAASADDNGNHGHQVEETSSAHQFVASVSSDDAGSSSAVSSALPEAANDSAPVDSSSHHSDQADSDHALDDSSAKADAPSSDVPAANDQGPASSSVEASPAALTVGMPSAEALQAAGVAGHGQHGGSVAQIVAEALGHGNATDAVDAVLNALPGGNGAVGALANVASSSANAVPGWDMSANGAFGHGHDMMMNAHVAMHHDAIQPVANG